MEIIILITLSCISLVSIIGYGITFQSLFLKNVPKTSWETTVSDFTLKSFALSILLGAWCLTGFEAAADMSEETKNPKFTVPKSIKYSLVSSGILGLIIILLSTIFLTTNNYHKINI